MCYLQVVFSVFWTLYSYDRSLVYPAIIDQYVAPHVNHFMHTDVALVVVLEMVLRPHHYHHRDRHIALLLLFCCSYFAWSVKETNHMSMLVLWAVQSPEDGGSKFLRDLGIYLQDHTAFSRR
jgi:hypothetical protein